MIFLITTVIVIACAVLGFFILIQNPKGGGLSGTFGNVSSQVMGVKQSGDIMEKGTWVLMSVIAGLCIISVMFMQRPAGSEEGNSAKSAKSAPAKPAPAKK
ncbi:preprotein translocase subunit SecG [Flavipsychrobacter stenotrophus]|uniref:Protein-export membrane protein SecG n=1 Tax=Flavipsychrobacter stenotrophus TaxID=2077091 RepID=A0A2S7SZY6_9BACT|nr:preprotein translocase subunit SecG [Flavipsychrobacter stenotrophus]PQJ12274.1 preprotein translocase subunit SecG [Flavipsychrobacter stenotrophus]